MSLKKKKKLNKKKNVSHPKVIPIVQFFSYNRFKNSYSI